MDKTREHAHAELGRLLISQEWRDTYAGAIVADAWEHARAQGAQLEALHGGCIQLGDMVKQYTASYIAPLDIIRTMADLTGYKWWVGDDGVLRFMAAPF